MRAGRAFQTVAAMLVSASPLVAQTDPCLRRSVPINVLTAKGETVTGLTPENFKASFHRKAVKIVSVTPDGAPRRVMIVLDSSRSMMSQSDEWHDYVKVARYLAERLPTESAIGLVVFTEKIERLIPLTNDRAKVRDELAKLDSGAEVFKGKTAVWDAIIAASSEFVAPQEGDAIYAVTDGGDNSSKTDFGKLRTTLLQKRIRIFAFSQQFDSSGPTHELYEGPMELQELIGSTGGYAVNFNPNAVGRLPELTDKSGKPTPEGALLLTQFGEILSFNRVEIELTERFEKIQGWSLAIAGLNARNLIIVYPRKLAGCGPNTLNP
jgi:von Willebrand factor type A domain